MSRIDLESFLEEKSARLEELRKVVGLLRRVDFPATVNTRGKLILYSEDYFRATDFEIKKRSQHLSGGSCSYDGNFSRDRVQTYPQFYFNLNYRGLVVPVYTRHEGFETDNRIIIKNQVVTRGSGVYSSENGVEEDPVDIEKVFDFFREKGVKECLIEKLNRRIKEAGEF